MTATVYTPPADRGMFASAHGFGVAPPASDDAALEGTKLYISVPEEYGLSSVEVSISSSH